MTEALNARGATVIAADIQGSHTPEECTYARERTASVRLDVTRKADVVALVRAVQAALGGIDILVNVAGVVSLGSAESLDESEWDRVMAINLKGSFLCCQAVLADMRGKRYGRIVNIGSVVGKNGGNARPWISPDEQDRAGNIAYGISKAGVHAMTAFLAKEMAAHGVTVNAVAPGPVATSMTTQFPKHLSTLIPVGRMASAVEVARAVLFLASAEAGFITGEVLDVNGGLWCD